MAKYRKIDPRIWNDEKFYTASLSCQHLFFFILTHPHMTSVGAMRTTKSGLMEELDWVEKGFPKAFPEAFAEGCAKGFWKYDTKAKFLVVPNFMKYNPPESPNVVKSWAGCWNDLPECGYKNDVYQSLKDLAKGLGEGFLKAFTEGFPEGLPEDYAESGAGTGIKEEPIGSMSVQDQKKELFDTGIPLLTSQGMKESDARKFIGKSLATAGPADALLVMRLAKQSGDAASYIAKASFQIPLPNDNRELWAIRKKIGLPFEYENLEDCHNEIRQHLRKHPELREALA